MSVAFDEDIFVLEDVEFETPCDGDDDNAAEWVMVLRARPCGCLGRSVYMICEECRKMYADHYEFLATCSICATPTHIKFKDLIISVERL